MSDVDIVWRAGWQQGADLIFQVVEETLMIERCCFRSAHERFSRPNI